MYEPQLVLTPSLFLEPPCPPTLRPSEQCPEILYGIKFNDPEEPTEPWTGDTAETSALIRGAGNAGAGDEAALVPDHAFLIGTGHGVADAYAANGNEFGG
jgi:hypothetical protein